MNWVNAFAWIMRPAGSPPRDLYAYVSRRVRIKPVRLKVKMPRGIKRDSIPKLKKDLDKVFSLFIRQRGVLYPSTGMGLCVTCGRMAHWKEMDCGHYQPRQDYATRWEEQNCHLQCKPCNGFRGGEPEAMAAHIDRKYGRGTAEKLRGEARKPFKLSRSWLEIKIKEYREKIIE